MILGQHQCSSNAPTRTTAPAATIQGMTAVITTISSERPASAGDDPDGVLPLRAFTWIAVLGYPPPAR